jgi:hypothetical protein
MSAKNKKNMATQALLEMDEITAAIKEESKKTLNALLVESVKEAIRESCDEAQEDDDYEVIDGEDKDATDTEEMSQDSEVSSEGEDMEGEMNDDSESVGQETDAETQEGPEDMNTEGESDNEWSEFSKYQVSDDTYDLTGENDYESVVKVYKLLKDDDQVVVQKDGDKITLKDDNVGTEYVIDLGSEDGDVAEVDNSEEDFDSLQESITWQDEFDPIYQLKKRGLMKADDSDIAGFGGGEIEGDESDIEDDMTDSGIEPKNHRYASDAELDAIINPSWDDEEDDEFIFESKHIKKNNIKESKTRKPMKESKEVLFEVDLGYTDNYQDKDPIAGLSNNEPSKSGKSWHKGVPTGTQKPWAGETKSKGEPFEKTVNEEEMVDFGTEEMVDEATNVGGGVQQRTSSKSKIPANRKDYGPMNKRHVTTGSDYNEMVAENKRLKKENKELKEAIISFKKHLNEAYITNANLGKITKLFLENTTSKAEKIDIVNRFSNEAKTIEQSKTLYESIKRELNKPVTTQMPINESMTTAKGSTALNEEKVYKSNDLLKTLDFMNRMKNI